MNYVVSDIHGCYNEYIKALELINFSDNDNLYILGDCMDRGENSVAILMDIIQRKNVYAICGNHDIEALCFIKELLFNETSSQNSALMTDSDTWFNNGGEKSFNQFKQLSESDARMLLDYIENLPHYIELEVNGVKYLLLHGGLEPFDPNKNVSEYTKKQIINSRINSNIKYFDNIFTITGHTQTPDKKILKINNHIAIDCGCAYGGSLAIYCLETKKEFYVKGDLDFDKAKGIL